MVNKNKKDCQEFLNELFTEAVKRELESYGSDKKRVLAIKESLAFIYSQELEDFENNVSIYLVPEEWFQTERYNGFLKVFCELYPEDKLLLERMTRSLAGELKLGAATAEFMYNVNLSQNELRSMIITAIQKVNEFILSTGL